MTRLDACLCQQLVQLAVGLQPCQVVVTTHMVLTDEDLRHRVAVTALHHDAYLLVIAVDMDFFVQHPLPLQQTLGTDTVWMAVVYICTLDMVLGLAFGKRIMAS